MANQNSILSKTLVTGIIFLFIGVGIQPVISITKEGNSPPYTPTPITPDGSICGLLEWYGGDPDGDNVTYDIYFGKYDPFSNPPWIATIGPYPGNQTYIYYQIEGLLNFETKYEWKIVAWDEHGLNSTSEPCLFETEKNYPPNPAKDPYPPDGATDVNTTIICWNGSDPNKCEILRYDVYFGPNPDPPLVSSNQTINFYDPYGPGGDWPFFKIFYWRIDTRDMKGLETRGDNWSFSTGINQPPTNPVIDGPSEGKEGVEYNYSFVSDDPDNHSIMYEVDWNGDNIVDIVTDLFPHNEPVILNNSWYKGTYTIQARAIDEYDAESNWTYFYVEIPQNRKTTYSLFQLLFDRFPFFLLERWGLYFGLYLRLH